MGCQTLNNLSAPTAPRTPTSEGVPKFNRTTEACKNNVRVIRAATYNLLNKNVKHAKNFDPWPIRSSSYADWVRTEALDIFATQEGVEEMIQSLKDELNEYGAVGHARSDDPEIGEFSAIFFNTKRFKNIRDGNFWLSPTPDVPESLGWGASITRLCTWVELQDRQNGKSIYVFNAHYDFAGIHPRAESSKLILEKIKEIAGENDVILLGDFNAEETSPELKPFVDNGLMLARTSSLTRAEGPDRTLADKRLDHIYVGADLRICRFATKTPKSHSGKDLSDHYPVVVEFVDVN